MTPESMPLCCDRCTKVLSAGRGEFYVIHIAATADPTPPRFTQEDLEQDIQGELDALIKKMSELSEQEANDQVYRRVILYLCNACYGKWIENPVGY